MKRINQFMTRSAVALAVAALLPSCAMEAPFGDGGDGNLTVSTEIKGEVIKNTRAISQEEMSKLRENCIVWISNKSGLVKRYKGVDNIPENIKMKIGHYTADAWSGDSVSASYDKKFYRAVQEFDVQEGQNTLTLLCKIANVVVSVDPESLDVALSDMKVTFSTSVASLEFTEENIATAKGYFMMPTADETTVTYKIEGKMSNGSAYVREGKIENVQRAHEYCMKVSANPGTVTEGGAFISISIADIPLIEDDIEIFPSPNARGVGYNIEDQVVSVDRNFADTKVYIRGYFGLSSVVMNFSDNFVGMTSGQNILTNSVITDLVSKGIRVERQESFDAANIDGGQVKVDEVYVTFTKEFLDALPASEREYVISFESTDSRNQVGTGSLRIANSDAAVEHVAPVGVAPAPDPQTDPMAVLAKSATLTGYVYTPEATNFGIRYREEGALTWTEAYPSSAQGASSRRSTRRNAVTRGETATFQVVLQNLKPGTTYEYKTFCDNYESADIQKFTTESVFVIDNASFENWSTYSAKTLLGTKTVILPGAGGDKIASFWGSGNEGGATANKILTDKSTDMVHSGQYSARLASSSAMGIIAAGNIFAGYYVETDGTNGVLKLGREYNGSHPSKVRVYANYRPGGGVTIKQGNENLVDIVKDGTDQGQIYVALTDEPIDIRTNPKNQKLFTTEDPHVLAYGQVTWSEAFGPDGSLQMIEIPFEYFERAKTTPSTHLVIVACASKFGDFFAGSSSSVLYLDDFELIYE